MAFHDALRYITTTASGKIRRINWEAGTYVCRSFIDKCIGVVLITTNKDGSINSEPFTAKSEDMLASDWCLVREDY